MSPWETTADPRIQVRREEFGTRYRLFKLNAVPDGKARCCWCSRDLVPLKSGELRDHRCDPWDGWTNGKTLHENVHKAYAAGFYVLNGKPRMAEAPDELREAKRRLQGHPACHCNAFAFEHRMGADVNGGARCKAY